MSRYRVEPGDIAETLFEAMNHFERALRERRGCQRVQIRKPFDARDALVYSRVVLHRAAERVEPVIYAVVPGRKPGEVAYSYVNLGELRHPFQVVFAETLRTTSRRRRSGHVQPRTERPMRRARSSNSSPSF